MRNGLLRTAAAAALSMAAAAASPAGDGDPPDGERFVVADFEDPSVESKILFKGSTYRSVPDPDDGPGRVARWTLPGNGEEAALQFKNLPADFSPWKCVRLRIRRVGPGAGMVYLRVFTTPTDETYLRLPGITEKWTTFAVDLTRTPVRGAFDPAKVSRIDVALLKPGKGEYHVDDVVLERTTEISPERRAREMEPAWVLDDFEDPGVGDRIDFKGGAIAAVPEKKESVLRWEIDGTTDPAALYFLDLPRNLRDYRTIRFKVRAEGDDPQPLEVKLQTGFTNALTEQVPKPGRKWQTVEIQIPKMREQGSFDADRCEDLGVFVFKPVKGVLLLDDVELVRGKGGWTLSEEEVCRMLFGERKAGKGMHRPSPHFDLYTDSSAAAAKLPAGLEKAHKFARDLLALPELDRAVPVYCFQNPETLKKFLVREWRWSEGAAARLTAVGNARGIVLSFRAPEDSQMVHELVHSLFHRGRGKEGGSWLQEGMAVLVERAWEKGDAAAEFAPNLRTGTFVPLAEFVAIPDLFARDDASGGAGTSTALFAQAGAFYAFLSRGPRSEKWKEVLPKIARTPVEPAGRAAALEEALGVKLPDLEKEWIEWGGKAGK